MAGGVEATLPVKHQVRVLAHLVDVALIAVHRHDKVRVGADGLVQRVAIDAVDEDGRDGDADARAAHVDGAYAVVVEDDRTDGAGVLSVHGLGGEEAHTAADQGDLAGHGAVGEVAGEGVGGLAVSTAHAAVERVGDNDRSVGGERCVVVVVVAVEDAVAGGVEAAGVVDHHVLAVAHCGRLARKACHEAVLGDGAVGGQADEHVLLVARATVAAGAGAADDLVGVGSVAVVDRDEVPVGLELELGEHDSGSLTVRAREEPVAIVAVVVASVLLERAGGPQGLAAVAGAGDPVAVQAADRSAVAAAGCVVPVAVTADVRAVLADGGGAVAVGDAVLPVVGLAAAPGEVVGGSAVGPDEAALLGVVVALAGAAGLGVGVVEADPGAVRVKGHDGRPVVV